MKVLMKSVAALFVVAAVAPALAQPMTSVLRLNERVSMETLAHNVTDATSPRFGQPYSPAEIRELAAPSQREYAHLLRQLEREGFRITSQSPTHLWLTIQADSRLFARVFGVRIQTLSFNLHRQMSVAHIPGRLSLIAGVTGFDNTRKAFPNFRMADQLAPGGISQDSIKNAYGFTKIYQTGITGKGQDIAIATYDNVNLPDVQQFYVNSQISPIPTVDQVMFNGTPAANEGSAVETSLDAEFSGMIAPGAQIHVFTSATNDDAGETQMFTAILDDNRAKVVNYSWGSCETSVTPAHKAEMEKVLSRAVAQGVNILVASGDSGSDSCQDGSVMADWPTASPSVVAVGGTTFSQNGSSMSETGWSGSGGGISTIWDLPTYQTSLGSPYTKRSYPDVSFNADPNSGQAVWVTYQGRTGWMTIGGTSMAAPQWAGFMALVGEARQSHGKATLGFLNPIIYGFTQADLTSTFNDVTSGSNGAFKAGPGWDAVTGFGSMQASALLNRLQSN